MILRFYPNPDLHEELHGIEALAQLVAEALLETIKESERPYDWEGIVHTAYKKVKLNESQREYSPSEILHDLELLDVEETPEYVRVKIRVVSREYIEKEMVLEV